MSRIELPFASPPTNSTDPHMSSVTETFCTGTLLTDLKFFDANGSTDYESGEDIVIDVNGNGIFD